MIPEDLRNKLLSVDVAPEAEAEIAKLAALLGAVDRKRRRSNGDITAMFRMYDPLIGEKNAVGTEGIDHKLRRAKRISRPA